MNYLVLFLIFCLVLMVQLKPVNAGVMAGHQHKDLHKERTEDGALSPRDREHFGEDGKHNTDFDHEAILGSYSASEEFDHLPPAEAKKRLAVLVKKMDLNADGFVSRQELKAWILRSFKHLSEEEARERLEEVDDNGDNKVTWDEWIASEYGSGDDNLIADEDKTMWNAADANKDNILNFDEFLVFTHPEEHPEMFPIFLQQTLKDKDTNNDDAIDFQEFVGERAKERDREWLEGEKLRFDTELDKNGDGKMTGSEIIAWVVPSNEEIADEEVDHLFAHSDDNHDDILSLHEILEHYDTFVGSEVTDYGDHLHNMAHNEL